MEQQNRPHRGRRPKSKSAGAFGNLINKVRRSPILWNCVLIALTFFAIMVVW